jgi:flagellar hook protein FlgE
MADADGHINTGIAPSDIVIPLGTEAVVKATDNVTLAGNLSASDTATTITRTLQVYDSVGFRRDVTVTFTRRAPVTVGTTSYNAWTWSADYEGTAVANIPAGQTGVLLFDTGGGFFDEGSVTAANVFTSRSAMAGQNEISIPVTAFTGDTRPDAPLAFDINFQDVTDMAAATDVTMTLQDGYPRGVLESYNISGTGTVNGVFSNGMTRVLGQIALASFGNVGGLSRMGNNMFVESPASGIPQIGLPETGGRGTISGNSLEGSNVDLGTEFSNMIVTQRGYQANARTITTADTLMQEAVNLVR